MEAVKEIQKQLEKETQQKRKDFADTILKADKGLINLSTKEQIALIRKNDISRISFQDYEDNYSKKNISSLLIETQVKEPLFGSLRLDFNTATERNAALAALLKKQAAKAPTTARINAKNAITQK